ncbi:MAG: hypothetical protein ACI4PY_04865, partial [Akkermansia muciniphila]
LSRSAGSRGVVIKTDGVPFFVTHVRSVPRSYTPPPLKKRTRLIPVVPSEASLLRLLTARLMDLSDEWEGNYGRAYISPEKLEIIAEVLKAAAPQPSPNIAA